MQQTGLFLLFFGIIYSLFGLMLWYLYVSFRNWLAAAFDTLTAHQLRRLGLWIIIVGSSLLVSRPVLGWLGFSHHPVAQVLVVYPAGFFFGAVVLGFVLLSLRDFLSFLASIVLTPFRRQKAASRSTTNLFDPARRRFLKTTGLTTAGVIGATPILSSILTSRDYTIVRLPLSFPNLPPRLNGFTIAQVSDLHSGPFMTQRQMEEIFEIVNSLNANLIVLTGDFVDSNDHEIEPLSKALGMLRAEFGMLGCLGNHDHFATPEKVASAIQQRNITLLKNSHRTLSVNGEKLTVVGVDDAGRGVRYYARLADAVRGLDWESFKIMLTHQPRFFPQARKAGMDLTLAGHTHGGQVGIEYGGINLNPVYLVHEYARGLYEEEGKKLYVNVGVGMVGVPIRLVPPEITLITLQSALHG
ncbi:MAG TPA: metallophosphoesterase [Bacteroidota bacterium]|nr:metallophosphoesterase [Bacteroidota bacterium]